MKPFLAIASDPTTIASWHPTPAKGDNPLSSGPVVLVYGSDFIDSGDLLVFPKKPSLTIHSKITFPGQTETIRKAAYFDWK